MRYINRKLQCTSVFNNGTSQLFRLPNDAIDNTYLKV